MDLKALAQTVAKFAPILASVLPFPGAAAVGAVIAKEFGGSIQDPDDLIKKINSDPDALLKLRAIEANERIEIEKLSLQKLKAINEDVANARQREIEVSKVPVEQRDNVPSHLAIVFITAYFALAFFLVIAMWLGNIDGPEQQTIIEMLKEQSLAVMLILAYYFGASNKR